jgi:hypothetical protein
MKANPFERPAVAIDDQLGDPHQPGWLEQTLKGLLVE